MADQTSTLKIGAEVEGAPSIKDLTAAYQQMTAGVQNFSSLLARVRPAAAAPDQPKNLGQKVISAAGNLGMEGLRGAANVAGGAIKSAASSLLGFAGPLSNVAMASLTTAPTAVAAGLALVAVVPFVFNLGVTYNLMRRSWKWANDAMEKQFDVAYRTRRTFPGIIGEEFARITPYVKARMGMTSALFGEAAASMEDMITRRLTPERLMRGVRGEKDLFSSVGITPGFIAQMERMKGQSLNVGGRARLDLTDYLAIFIKKREALEAQILAAPEGSTLRQLLSHRKSQMLDKSLRVFNARFADLASFMTMDDLKKLGEQSRASTGLNVVTKESVKNAAEFRLAVGTTREIFYQLKMGIGREVQPVITRIMTDLADWLLPIREDGQSMAMNLRNLGAAIAIKGWEVMAALIRRINPQTVRRLMDRMKQWRPEGSIKILMFLARELQYLAEGLVTTLLAAAKALRFIKIGEEFQGLSAEEIVRRKKAGLPLVGPATPRLGPGAAGVGVPGGLPGGLPGGAPGGGGGYLGGGRRVGSPSGTGYLNDSGVGPAGDTTPSPESGAGSFRLGAQQRMNYFQMQGKGPYERSQLSTVKTPFGKVAAHPQAEADVAGFFNELQGLGAPIKKLGSYNKRRMRRGSMWSSHGYGVAFDLDDAQYLSPQMKAWIKANPDKWSAAKKRWNMSQMQSTEKTGGTGGWDPGHVEWVGPAGKQAERAPGVAPGAVTVERGAPSVFGPIPTVTPEGKITYAPQAEPQAPQAVQPTRPGQPVTTGGPFPTATLQTTDPSKKARVKNLEPLIQKAAKEHGVDPNILRTFVSIESGGDPNRVKGSYKGLTALDENQFREFGGQGSIYDPYQNLKAGAKRLSTYNKDFKRRHGRDATDAELYFYHQQGPSGSEHHIKNPDQPAWMSFWNATGRSQKWPPERAKKAIYGNLTPAAQSYFRQKYGAGWEGKITSREFTDYWRQNYYNQGKFVGSYVGGGTPEGVATQEVQKDQAAPIQVAAPTTEMPKPEQALLTTAPPSVFGPAPTVRPEGQVITPPPSVVSAGPTVRPTGVWGGKSVNQNVLQARIRQANDDWMRNPKNQQLVYRLLQAEGGPQNIGANLEQLSNYAAAHGKTIQQVMEARGTRQYYGPMRRLQQGGLKPHERDAFLSPWTENKQKVWDDARQQVFEGGSNRIDYRTMQGMKGDPNWQLLDVNIGGNRFGIQPGTERWVAAQRGAGGGVPQQAVLPAPEPQWPTTEMPKAEQAVLTTAPPQAIPASVVTGPVGEQVETASRVRQLQMSQARDRRLPITPQLQDVLNRAGAEAGLEVHVTSGGQRYIPGAAGRTIKGVRTGSIRHDLRAGQLGSADVKFWDPQQRRYLDFRNPNDRPRMEKAVEASVAAGATGVGAGMKYMGGQTVHIGGGDVATWGAEGKGGFVSRAHKRGRERRARGDIPAAAPTYQGVPQLTPTTVTATVPVSYTQSDLYQTLGEMTGLSPDVAQQLASTPEGHAKLAKYMREQQDEEDRINKRGKYTPVTPEDVANLKALSDQLASGQLTAADLATPAVWRDAEKVSKDKERELFAEAIDTMKAKDREALKAREDLVKPAIDVQKPAIEEGTAAGKAATKAFKDGIKDVKIPVKSLTEEEKNRDQKVEEKEKEAEAA